MLQLTFIHNHFHLKVKSTQQHGSETGKTSFRVINDVLNGKNLIVAIAQLCNDLKGCNFTML